MKVKDRVQIQHFLQLKKIRAPRRFTISNLKVSFQIFQKVYNDYPKCWGTRANQTDKVSALKKILFQKEAIKKNVKIYT